MEGHRMRDTSIDESLELLEQLVSPFGVVSATHETLAVQGLDGLIACTSLIGSYVDDYYRAGYGGITRKAHGRAINNPDRARLTAIAEGAERYAAVDFAGSDQVWARRCELDGPMIDLDRIPRCSATELARPDCPLAPLDPDAALRWVRGTDLMSGTTVWLPAIMACYGLRDIKPAERFWYRISTGWSVHFDPAEALVGGICEVIERDAIAITWLQQLQLPVVAASNLPESVQRLTEMLRRIFLRAVTYDATTDLGVPTAYCLLTADHDRQVRQTIGCATGRTFAAAAEKALLEALSVRETCRCDEAPESLARFQDVADGARYMARASRAGAFGFLTDERRASGTPPGKGVKLPQQPGNALAWLTRTLAARGMQAIAVDRTCMELADIGLTAVCVVIPDLQPMTLLPLAQFRAHPRLYSAPALMGYPVRNEKELNPWPQPLA
jgi:ribosomal protein S12 methylthiotransferase accessory factor